MRIQISEIPPELLEAVREIAAGQGVVLTRPEDLERYILEDEDAQELVLPYIDL